MPHLIKDPLALAAMLVGLCLALFGMEVGFLGGEWLAGILLFIAGVAMELAGAALHDRWHRRRGDSTHAMWGTDDRNKPAWWPFGARS